MSFLSPNLLSSCSVALCFALFRSLSFALFLSSLLSLAFLYLCCSLTIVTIIKKVRFAKVNLQRNNTKRFWVCQHDDPSSE